MEENTVPKVPVEAMVLAPIKRAAKAQADKDMRQLPVIARAILLEASKKAEPSEDGVAHPASRPTNANRLRIRFRMDPGEYEIVRDRIRASGQSVAAALEKGLERYARTGKIN